MLLGMDMYALSLILKKDRSLKKFFMQDYLLPLDDKISAACDMCGMPSG